MKERRKGEMIDWPLIGFRVGVDFTRSSLNNLDQTLYADVDVNVDLTSQSKLYSRVIRPFGISINNT